MDAVINSAITHQRMNMNIRSLKQKLVDSTIFSRLCRNPALTTIKVSQIMIFS